MSLSKDKKRRRKLDQQGKYNPENSRGGQYIQIKTTTKKTKTKTEKVRHSVKKHKKRTRDYLSGSDASFYFAFFLFFFQFYLSLLYNRFGRT